METQYIIKWAQEVGWAILVGVIVEVGQILVQSDMEQVMSDPAAWGVTIAGAVARVAWVVARSRLQALFSRLLAG